MLPSREEPWVSWYLRAASHWLLCSLSGYYYKGVPLICSLSMPKDRPSFYLLFQEWLEPGAHCPLESSSLVCPFADLTSLVGRDQLQMLLKLQPEAMQVIAEFLNFKETSLECVWRVIRSGGLDSLHTSSTCTAVWPWATHLTCLGLFPHW